MRILSILIGAVLFFLALIFCIDNSAQQVTLAFFGLHSPPLPVYLVILFSAVAGVVIVGVWALLEGIKMRLRNLQLSRRIKKLEVEIDSLRALTLGGGSASEPALQSEEPAPEPSEPAP
ncbi:MAG: lipopolysaccharide assembly protein LapA domain-containing protein [Acidobacteriota bacterium]